MERKESAHGLQLVKFGAIRLKGHFSALFMGTFAMVTPLILVILVPLIMSILLEKAWILSIGVVLFAICVGPMQIGYIKFFNGTLNGEQPRISMVYSQFKFDVFTLRTIYIATLLLVLYLVGGILWIVPAGFAVAFYSMTLFFHEKYKYPRLSQAMNECAKHMIGNRLSMFSYKLIFYFVYFLLFMVGGLCMALVYVLAIDSLLISWIIAVCSAVVFIFFYTMITVYFHSCNQVFFEETLMYNERKRNKKKAQEIKIEKVESEDKSQETKSEDIKTSEESLNDSDQNNIQQEKETQEESKSSKTQKKSSTKTKSSKK